MYIRFVNYIDQLNQYRQTKISNRNFLVIAALMVGILAGLAAALLKTLTHHIENFLQTDLHWEYKYYLYLLFPTIGILLSVMYVRRFIKLYGEGYITIKNLLRGDTSTVIKNSIFSSYQSFPGMVILFTLLTIFAKSVATLVTLGAGGNGGVFAPSLIMGGLMGFIVAYSINTLGIADVNVANFIVAGMAAALGSIMHAPLTGIFLIAEITGGYVLMVPLMITTALAYLINRSANKYSIYTKPLAEKGELSHHEDKDTTVLNMMKLKYIVEKDYLSLAETALIKDRMEHILQSKRNIFPVVDLEGHFKGLLYVEDILKELVNVKGESQLTVKDLMQQAPAKVNINLDLQEVLRIMEMENAWILPVIADDQNYIGFVSKTAIFNKYRLMLRRQADYLS